MGSLGDMIKSKPVRQQPTPGGFRASLFVYAIVALENMAFISNSVSLVTYFFGYMNFGLTKSANTLTNFLGTSYLLSLFGGFVSDTFLSRFKTTIVFGCLEVLGFAILAVQAHLKQLRPFSCKDLLAAPNYHQCEDANSSQVAILYTGLYLVALGDGGIKAATPALGADQFDEKNPEEVAKLPTYFNWLLSSVTFGAILGITFLVWISENKGWDWSFGVCTAAVITGILCLTMGSSIYRNNVPNGSPFLRILQVIVVAIRNRNVPIPAMTEQLHEADDHAEEDGIKREILPKTNQFKFLDRAAIVTKSQPGTPLGPWKLCTITQVEETKILVRMLPIILSTTFMNTCLAQLQTFSVQQSTTLNTNVKGFHVPGPSIPVIPMLAMFLLIPIYEYVFVPAARKVTGIPTGIRQLQRIGVGLVLSAISMAVAGIVETRRKSVAVEHGMVDSPGPLPMSVFWLGYQYAIFGIADMFTLVGMLDFFYSESSSRMKSLGTAISWCSFALGYYLSSLVVDVVNKLSGGWLESNNLNRDKLNYFYWLLSGLSVLNFGVYLLCASRYRYKSLQLHQQSKLQGEDELLG